MVFELDSDYQYAFVAGNTTNYLWLLSRTATVSDELKEYFLQRAEELGFEVDDLIFVDQGLNQNAVGSDSAAPLKNDLGWQLGYWDLSHSLEMTVWK